MRRTRRALLAAAATTVATLPGCAAVRSDSDDTPTTNRSPTGTATPTETATETVPPDPAALSFSATVAQQAGADAPARFDVTLANDGDAPVAVGADPALFAGFAGTFPELALVVRDASGVDASRTDGCWRVTVDKDQAPVERAVREVPAGDAITENYDLYTRDRAEECLPAGTYAVTADLPVVGVDEPVSLTLQFGIEDGLVTVDEDGTAASA